MHFVPLNPCIAANTATCASFVVNTTLSQRDDIVKFTSPAPKNQKAWVVGWMLQVFSAVGQVGEAPGVFARYHPKTLGTLVTQDSEPAGWQSWRMIFCVMHWKDQRCAFNDSVKTTKAANVVYNTSM